MDFAKHVKVRQEKFGAVIFDTLREKIFVTNGTGGDILELIAEQKSLDEIVQELRDRYTGESSSIEEGVQDFVRELVESSFVTT